jgi:tRNA (mo5U34)-methyltransferase
MSTPASTEPSLREQVGALEWYHTMELAPGVETPGWNDTRPILGEIPFPASLAGKRCLDVGTFDGYWAFEMERRGASEVIAIDLIDPDTWDWPAGPDPEVIAAIGVRKAGGRGFEIAQRELGSSVKRLEKSVYDLDRAEVGTFDLVFVGSLLVHLRDPVLALERVRSVCSGTVIVMDGIDLLLTLIFPRRAVATFDGVGRPWWWTVNQLGLARMIEAAGLDIAEGPRRMYIPPGRGQPLPRLNPKLLTTRLGRYSLVLARKGDPHAVVVARPRPGID